MGAEKEKEQKVTHNERFKVLVSLIWTSICAGFATDRPVEEEDVANGLSESLWLAG